VRAVVVAVVHRLDQHDPEIQPHEPAVAFLVDRVSRGDSLRGLDQLVAAARSVLWQLLQAGRLCIALVDVGVGAYQAAQISLLG
jgi:hypothetical protein